MRKIILLVLFLCFLFFDCKKKTDPTNNTSGSNQTNTPVDTGQSNNQKVSVLTQHNNSNRTGWNNRETSLNIQNVNNNQFGKLFTLTVDDQVYSQPLVVSGITLQGGVHNILFVATVNNSIYAFDGTKGTLYWQKNYTQPGMRPPQNTDMTGACGGMYEDFTGNIGIVGTPVIDSVNQALFFVARSTDGLHYFEYLHKVSLVSGQEMGGSPIKIMATYSGTGDGNINNILTFDPQKSNQRGALTQSQGIVYITTSSHCDWGPYHGWILGYNSSSLSQQFVFNTTPNDGDGGIWQSGGGLAVDDQGNLFTSIGNGDGNTSPTDGLDFGESDIKLTPTFDSLKVTSYFTSFNFTQLNRSDLDFGSFGSFLIPNTHLFFTGGKDQNLYLLNKDNMGGWDPFQNNVYQNISLNINSGANFHCLPAYYNGAAGAYIYIWSEFNVLRAIPFNTKTLLWNGNGQILGTNGPAGG